MKNLSILSKDFELTEAIKNQAEAKLASLYRFINLPEDEVTFNLRLGKTSNHHQTGKIFYAEVTLTTPGKNFGCRVESEDIYNALDKLKEDLIEIITEHKKKVRDLEIKNARKFKGSIVTAALSGEE